MKLQPKDLLKLADHLDGLKTINDWETGDQVRGFSINAFFFDCGTPACAIGHCTAIWPEVFSWGSGLNSFGVDTVSGFSNESALREFGISEDDSQFISNFQAYPAVNPRAKTVAKRIREIVKKYQ